MEILIIMMKQLNINGFIVNVNVERTKELYDALPLISDKEHCGCDDCTNYTKATDHFSSSVKQFFEQFGIDPRKEAEVSNACSEDGMNHYLVDYHFIGEIEDVKELDWINVDGVLFGLTNYDGQLPSPMIPNTFSKPIIELIVQIDLQL